jgi:hypothetical protein
MLDEREARGAPRLDGHRLAVAELAHVELAGRGAALGAVRLPVDHHAAAAADALAAVGLEGDRLAAVLDDVLVELVEQLQEGHLGRGVRDLVGLEVPCRGLVGLAPDLQREPHL